MKWALHAPARVRGAGGGGEGRSEVTGQLIQVTFMEHPLCWVLCLHYLHLHGGGRDSHFTDMETEALTGAVT